MRLRLQVALFLVLPALALLAPSSASAAQWRGVQVSPYWANQSQSILDRQLDLAQAAGANVVRANLGWSSLQERSAGAYSSWYVARADALFAGAAQRGMRVIPNVWGTPCWASSAPADVKQGCEGDWWDRDVTKYPPTNMDDYARVSEWIAARWGGHMAGYEIWNEPDHTYWITPDQAGDYTRLVRATYPAVKRARPDLQVVAGGLSGSDGEFVNRLYDAGIRGYFDALSIHPYHGERSPAETAQGNAREWSFASGVPWVREIMAQRGDPKPIWLTEFGTTTCTDLEDRCVTEPVQASHTSEAWRIIDGWDFVQGATQYQIRDNGDDRGAREDNFGLLREDLSPKPAYAAFKASLLRSAGAAAGQSSDQRRQKFTVSVRLGSRRMRRAVRRGLWLKVRCPYKCKVQARVRKRGVAGRRRTARLPRGRGTMRVPFPRRLRGKARRRDRLGVVVQVVAVGSPGGRAGLKRPVVLRKRRGG